jgi:hypothetical protein
MSDMYRHCLTGISLKRLCLYYSYYLFNVPFSLVWTRLIWLALSGPNIRNETVTEIIDLLFLNASVNHLDQRGMK